MVNDLTGQVSPGWPRDWWADDRNPFPGMTEVHLLNEMGYTAIANADDKDLSRDPLYVMFKNIQSRYGWGLFARTFSHMATDHVRWTDVDGGRNASPVLTNLVCAYLTMGSGDTATGIAPLFQSGPIPAYDLDTVKSNLRRLGYGGGALADGAYAITSVESGLVLDAGARGLLRKVSAGPVPRWRFARVGDGEYTVTDAATGKALDRSRKGVTLAPATRSFVQPWRLTSTDNGYVLTDPQSGRALADAGGKLELRPADSTTAQKWIVH
jgi:hypothetical protein